MIQTTEELFKEYSVLCQFEEGPNEYLVDKESFQEALINFAKLHVQAALKEAGNKVKTKQGWWQDNNIPYGASYTEVDKQSILTAYPLSNIK